MSRENQTGNNAPNRGTVMRSTHMGVGTVFVPAADRYPPPPSLTEEQAFLWRSILSDISVDFFRERHLPYLVVYVRTVSQLMNLSDQLEEDVDNPVMLNMMERRLRIALRMERHMGFDIRTLLDITIRARAEQRVALQEKTERERAAAENRPRTGLVYVGY